MKEPGQLKRHKSPSYSVRHHHYNRIGQLDHIEHLRLYPASQPWHPPQRQAHRSQRYSYNAQQRLVSEAVHSHQDDGRTIGQGEQHWHYDRAGNRIHPDDTRYRPLERAAPGNRLHRSAQARYRHDAWGNVVQIDHTSGPHKGQQVRLAYDGEHRLLVSERIQTNTDGQRQSVLTCYHYDPMSRRVGKQHLKRVSQGDGQKSEWRIQSSLWFGWDGDRMVTMQNERQASTSIYEPDSFVPMLRVDKQLQADDRRAKGELRTFHVHCNHLGTPEALIAQDSLQLVWQIELDPWGQTQREYNPNNMLQPIRMQGQQVDAETGLFYNRYRYYDPAGGRYVTQDPIGLLGGVNLYGYVGGDPLFFVDPLGLRIIPQYLPRGQMPRPIVPSSLPRDAAYQAAAEMTATPTPGFDEKLDLPCVKWDCSSPNSLVCKPNDVKKSNDFIPPAITTADPPEGCRCIKAGRDPAYQQPFDPNQDPITNSMDAIENRKPGMRLLKLR